VAKWLGLKGTKKLLAIIAEAMRIAPENLIHRDNPRAPTWGHPQVAIRLAGWVKPSYEAELTKWLFELTSTGFLATDIASSSSAAAPTRPRPELVFKAFLDENKEDDYVHNEISADDTLVCGKYRPDFLYQLPTHCIVVEVDEHEHAHEDPRCEVIRMFKMTHGLGIHTVFLRFNPDGETPKSELLTHLKHYKTLVANDLEDTPLLTVEYFGYSLDREAELRAFQETELVLDSSSMIRSLQGACAVKDEEISALQQKLESLRSVRGVRMKETIDQLRVEDPERWAFTPVSDSELEQYNNPKECQFCQATFSQRCSLIRHQQTAKTCLKLQREQGLETPEPTHTCACGEAYHLKHHLARHQASCTTMVTTVPSSTSSTITTRSTSSDRLPPASLLSSSRRRSLRLSPALM
jgi:hypothetical protein